MIDSRFYQQTGPARIDALLAAAGLDASVSGISDPGRMIHGIRPPDLAGPDDMTICKKLDQHSRGGLVFAPVGSIGKHGEAGAVIMLAEPFLAYSACASLLFRALEWSCSSPAALIEPGMQSGSDIAIGAGAMIGSGVRLGDGVVIGPGVCIGRDCVIGAGARIGFALIGDRVEIGAGTVIGEPMSGLAHFGRVIIQENARIGAGIELDRGLLEDVHIAPGASIDNMAQIGHNHLLWPCRLERENHAGQFSPAQGWGDRHG